jgi:uncharacterized protein (DUF1778 family)
MGYNWIVSEIKTMAIQTPLKEKSARLSCRIRPQVKEQAEEAARILGQSITDFAESALEEKAKAILAENERITLSAAAFTEFLAAISGEPEKPSEKLLSAVEAYKRHEPVPGSV